MARAALLAGVLALACICNTALGFAVPGATLNQLTRQTTITQLNNELNPYGLFPITVNSGKLKAGNFLATQWNDANNNPGQGHTILQVTPQGATTMFATIPTNSPVITKECGNFGVGLTMALVVLSKGYVIVGSTPIPVGGNVAGSGCLILLDSKGNVLDAHAANEKTSSGTMTGGGPWAMAVQESNHGSTAYLFVSYVLGNNPAITTTVNAGMVVRYGLQLPGGSITPNFWGPAPDVIATGFPTQPGNIGAGAVGPTGLLLGYDEIPNKTYKKNLKNWPLFIANNLANSVQVVAGATSCFTLPGARPQCKLQTVASGGLINGPIGLAQSPAGTIVGANGGVGTLFEIAPVAGANLQLADQFVDNLGAAAGQGDLFNVMFHPKVPNTLFFNDDGTNTFNTLSMGKSSSHHGRKLM